MGRKAAQGQTGEKGEALADRIIAACLALAAEKGWDGVSLSDIAARAGVSLGQMYVLYDDRTAILAAFARRVDRAVLTSVSASDPDLPVRERLFDVLMERFEILNADRDGVIAVLASVRRDPKQAVIGLPHLARSMCWMLEAAGVETTGWRGAVRIAGLTALWLRVAAVWAQDDSPDMGRTMAALDGALAQAERAAGFIERITGDRRTFP
ncbi:MAG: TetR family transcriptional regulator [Rhodospirillales bacterium]|nr:TetR family transcriptional regulator [Rhodospirillales bacterium]